MIKKFLFVSILLVSCSRGDHKPNPAEHIHYYVGSPYQLGEQWFYPEENFAYKATGLAIISEKQKGDVTADGEMYNPKMMTAGHPTLQLPAIVKVKNLDNGRAIIIRLNDRIYSAPGRLLELTPTAAKLLDIYPQSPAKIEISEIETDSQNLAFQLPNGLQTQFQIQSAPLSTIKVENLDGSSVPLSTHTINSHPFAQTKNFKQYLSPLPTSYSQETATGGQLWIEAGNFTSRKYARKFAAKVGGKIKSELINGKLSIKVMSGPYDTVQQADQQLEFFLKSGIKGAKIIIE